MMIEELLKKNNCTLSFSINRFNAAHPVKSINTHPNYKCNRNIQIEFDDSEWNVTHSVSFTHNQENAADMTVTFKLVRGSCPETNVGVSFGFHDWSRDNYVLMPAAVYDGNRFESRNFKYPPQLKAPEDLGVDIPTIITDVPRLNIHEGASRIQQLTRDLSTPAIGFFNPAQKKGLWLLTGQRTEFGDTGIDIEESGDRSKAVISVYAPGVRHDFRYTICNAKYPSDDKGADFKAGDEVSIKIRLYFFECLRVQDLFDNFVDVRKALTGPVKLYHQIPFHSAWKIHEIKYNEQNWVEQYGYYRVGTSENLNDKWQLGWVGGMMCTYPLLFEGTPLSKKRALRNFEFVFNGGQDISGLFFGYGDGEKWYGDNFENKELRWHLIRKSSDALYFIIKQFMLLKKQDPLWEIPVKWTQGIRRCAGAFVNLWKRYGQFGQFVDTETGDILIGGSASGGIAPAGLALAGQFFQEKEYIEVAKASALYFYNNFIKKGITTGGPGEICQCPDSESAFGLLEAFVTLYEVTGEMHWIKKAEETANQCMTWCVSYDFKFPPESTFGRLDMHTAGSVYANVQNKHSAPGICTLSGVSLFKLYRATGNVVYLDLIKEMAHNLPQYLSREDRPVGGMPPGWMNERVEMSDWLEPVGEIFFASCWCEVSSMLTYVEVPGLYVQPDTGFVCAIDHIDAKIIENSNESLVINVANPTKFMAAVKVLSENSSKMSDIMGQNALWGCRRIMIEPEADINITFVKEGL